MHTDPNFSTHPQMDIDAIVLQLRRYSINETTEVIADCRRRIIQAQHDLNDLNNQVRKIKQELHLDLTQSVANYRTLHNNGVT
jgi:hypothetical protein